ncbi:MAG: hypothetical protein LKG27_06885 [Clostridiaceae bacterium]|jgi:hypothetical protein|nr:hypothetical protein [Clostridiaceae bacterium]
MSITKIISAIGNNNSIAPLIVRDCGLEGPTKIAMAYNQNKSDKYIAKNAVRERIIDEYGTSLIWLGGIPFVEYIANKLIQKRGFNPKVNLKLFKEDDVQGINKNIEKFKDIAPDAVKDLIKVRDNKGIYEKLLSSKFLSAIAIPVALMGFILPKLNFALTKKLMNNKKPTNSKANKPSFTGNMASTIANFSTVEKMAMTDGGLTVGRITTSRKKNEAIDNAFKMGGMLYLNFIAPKQISKVLDNTMNKTFNINVNLDPLMLNDKEFIAQIKENKFELPKSNLAKDIVEFIDNNPKSLFVKFAAKFNKIKMLNENVRDPRCYVDTKKLAQFKKEIEKYSEKALTSNNIQQFAKRAKLAKSVNIISNVLISSTLLAVVLPKLQYKFRKLVTGSDLEPGLIK